MKTATLPDGLELHYLNLEEMKFLYEEIFVAKTYLKHGVTLRDGACVIDVGANIGLFALYVHRTFKNTKILAFEPVPEVFEILLANAAHHVIDAQLFPCALGAAAGQATFTFYVNNSVMSGMHADGSADRATSEAFFDAKNPAVAAEAKANPAVGRHVDGMFNRMLKAREFTVPVRPLADVIAEAKLTTIDLLKIDVEKAELDVIRGVGDANWQRIRQVVVEVHNTEGRLDALRSLFGVLGYQVVVEQDPMLARTNIWTLYGVRP
jgi:FkbM family methyltransferase